MKVLILYYTKTGHTLEAANATANGIRSAGSEANLVPIQAFDPAELTEYDGMIVGSPCWAGSVTPSGVAMPIVQALKTIPPGDLKGKRCGGISVHSGLGAETTVRTIGKILMEKGCEDYRSGHVARAGVPLSLWKGPTVRPEDEELFAAFGAKFVA